MTVNNNLAADRFNADGTGRKQKPIAGLREITGSLTVEYDSTTMRNAMLAETPMSLILKMGGRGAVLWCRHAAGRHPGDQTRRASAHHGRPRAGHHRLLVRRAGQPDRRQGVVGGRTDQRHRRRPMPDGVTIQGVEDIGRLGTAHRAGGKELRARIRKAMQEAAKPLAVEVRDKGAAKMPHQGGLSAVSLLPSGRESHGVHPVHGGRYQAGTREVRPALDGPRQAPSPDVWASALGVADGPGGAFTEPFQDGSVRCSQPGVRRGGSAARTRSPGGGN